MSVLSVICGVDVKVEKRNGRPHLRVRHCRKDIKVALENTLVGSVENNVPAVVLGVLTKLGIPALVCSEAAELVKRDLIAYVEHVVDDIPE